MRSPTAVLITVLAAACSEPPDDTPIGREFAALMAKPEQSVQQVKVQHVLVAFVGAKKGSESKRNYEEARAKTEQLLQRARAGEDFGALAKTSDDDPPGIFTLTQQDRGDYARYFSDVAFRLAVGEIGVTPFHSSKSPFGFHIIKRLE